MLGFKYKLAHKRADHDSWSSSDNTQKKRLIGILEEMIEQLRKEITS